MTFEDGMNPAGGYQTPDAVRAYDELLAEELGRERAEDLRERDRLWASSTASVLRRRAVAGLARTNGAP